MSSQLVNAYAAPTGGTTVVVTQYSGSTTCTGTTFASTYLPLGKCPATWVPTNGYFTVYSLAAALPVPPAGAVGVFNYTTAAACAATDASQVVGVQYDTAPTNATQTGACYRDSSSTQAQPTPAYNRNYCGPQAFTGGFIVNRTYSVSWRLAPPHSLCCSDTPLSSSSLSRSYALSYIG